MKNYNVPIINYNSIFKLSITSQHYAVNFTIVNTFLAFIKLLSIDHSNKGLWTIKGLSFILVENPRITLLVRHLKKLFTKFLISHILQEDNSFVQLSFHNSIF